MPLRDHFRSPVAKVASWEAVHGGWPMVIVQSLARSLPSRYVAHPRVHLGSLAEIDVSTYQKDDSPPLHADNGNGGVVATAVWAPPRPTMSVVTDLPAQDEYEVRVYDTERAQRLVAAIELVSPGNKDRPENRRAFIGKCAALLQNQVSVTIVDVVTIREFNLYKELLDFIGQTDPLLGANPLHVYAVACRATKSGTRQGDPWQLETWLQTLQIGQPLPTLPLWLADSFSVRLDLEESYEETCKALRIP
jgi:hypothetical protein